jgi:Asp-tRNA(Asn)/Glu-tRNA(Gln) amidotransferase A subunit family amidase
MTNRYIQSMPLATTATALRTGHLDLLEYVEATCQRIEAINGDINAFLLEPDRISRLRQEALALQRQFPEPASRPHLYGVLLGVKDIFRTAGFPTRAGSRLPPEVLAGAEASSVSALRRQGALVVGKTATAEFAYFDPGPTRNPHNLEHTPGGSSSGSAAAVAAGFCPLALGTQTVGSIIRPAAYCGLVGFKPSFDRIPIDGVIPFSKDLDHVGLFTQDVAGMLLVAALLCSGWRELPASNSIRHLPTLGIPAGNYLNQASAALDAFENHVTLLEQAGYRVRRVATLDDIQAIAEQNIRLMASGVAETHAAWFAQFEPLYGSRIADIIRQGQALRPEERMAAQKFQRQYRTDFDTLTQTNHIDLWISPATTEPAPRGLGSTGNPAMNMPWSFLGLPTITLPAGTTGEGLPLGLQCTGTFMADECLLHWSRHLAETIQ